MLLAKIATLALPKVKVWHQYGRNVKNKNQKVLVANSSVCRSEKWETDRGAFLAPPSWIVLITPPEALAVER